MKKLFYLCIFLLITTSTLAIESPIKLTVLQSPTKNILFEVKEAKKPIVKYSHIIHNKIKCIKCHHKIKTGDTNIKSCNECHNTTSEINLKSALHKNCKTCHKEMKKDNKKTGPITCRGCHKK